MGVCASAQATIRLGSLAPTPNGGATVGGPALPKELPKAGISLPTIHLGRVATAIADFTKSLLGIAGKDKPKLAGTLCAIDVGNRLAFMSYLEELGASSSSEAQQSMATLLDQSFYSLSTDDQDVLQAGLGEPWAQASPQEKIQFAASPSLSGPLFSVLQQTIQQRAPKGLPC